MAIVESIINFAVAIKYILVFYLIIAVIIYIFRKYIQTEGKIVFLYKTQFGVTAINKFADNNKKLVKVLGYIGIVVGFIGMLFIVYMFLFGLYSLLFIPDAPPVVSLVIPGVPIPGSPFIPFWYGIISLFIVIVVHEFGHGIVARAHGLKIKSTGLAMIGPFPGAFVEPDEKQTAKQKPKVQLSVFAAGPLMNIILAIVALLLTSFVVNPILSNMVSPTGVSFNDISKGYPAELYGLQSNTTYNVINGQNISSSIDFFNAIGEIKPNQSITFANKDSQVTVITTSSPEDSSKGYIGVLGIKTDYDLKEGQSKFAFAVLGLLSNPFTTDLKHFTLFQWIFVLSLGIGTANLLPLGPVDGGRMVHIVFLKWFGKKRGIKLWAFISWIVLGILIILVLSSIFKGIF